MSVKAEIYGDQELKKYAEVIFLKEGTFSISQEQVKEIIDSRSFKGKAGEIEYISIVESGKVKNFILVGLGKEEKISVESYKKAIAKVVKEGEKKKLSALLMDSKDIMVFSDNYIRTRVVAETAILAGYKFNRYKTDKEEKEDNEIILFIKDADKKGLEEGTLLAKSTLIARDLINEPSNIMTPMLLAKEAEAKGREAGFEVQIFDKDKITDFGMGAFLAVASGSERKPKLIVMRYFNDPDHPEDIQGVVGKGLIYDSGGLSIKPTNSMIEMKSDMAGGSAVIGAFYAIAKAKLKINVVGVIAACENMISGKSYRPGDILTTMAGKTVFVGNTDAEGRLTLVDAIHYIIEKEKVCNIIDIATLTGAAVVALGDTTTPVLSNNDDFYQEIVEASKEADERIWRLPIFDDYREKLKAKEADLTNSAGNPGAITAGLFIEAFVQDKPWVHMDIAGTSWTEKEYDYYSLGGTGTGVRTIYHWLKKKSR